MSHIVSIKIEVRDPVALWAACVRLQLERPQEGAYELFSGTVQGIAVRLPGWVYPIVLDQANGELKYDNFDGRWGDRRELDRFLQMYAVEKARLEARRAGNTVTESKLADGSIKLTIQVAGGAA